MSKLEKYTSTNCIFNDSSKTGACAYCLLCLQSVKFSSGMIYSQCFIRKQRNTSSNLHNNNFKVLKYQENILLLLFLFQFWKICSSRMASRLEAFKMEFLTEECGVRGKHRVIYKETTGWMEYRPHFLFMWVLLVQSCLYAMTLFLPEILYARNIWLCVKRYN